MNGVVIPKTATIQRLEQQLEQLHSQEPVQHKGEYLDRKRTLPKRIVKLALALTLLKPGEYVIVVKVPTEGDLTWRQAALPGG